MKKVSLLLFPIALMFCFSCEEAQDCAGVVGGDAQIDECGVCDEDPANDCVEDCAGEWGGNSICGCTDSTAVNYDSTATFDDGSCTYDTSPPTVLITSAFEGSVYEIVTISVMVSDDAGIEKVELWVDGVNTNITDDTEPYEILWNTTTYDDGSVHIIVVRAYDINGNTADTPALPLTVDNSGSHPTPAALYPIVHQDGSFIISWSQNQDEDFSSYSLLEGYSEDINTMDTIYTTNAIDETTYTVSGISAGETRFYQTTTEDQFGLSSGSNVESGTATTLWSHVHGHPDVPDWGNSVIEVSDGYWLTGVVDGDKRLLKTDLMGNIVTDLIIDIGYGNEILESQDGSLYIIGGVGEDIWTNMHVIKTDDSGVEIWNRTTGGTNSYAYGGIINANNEIIIYGEQEGYAVVYSMGHEDDPGEGELVLFDHDMDRVKGLIETDSGYLIAFSKDYETRIIETNYDFIIQNTFNVYGYCRSLSQDPDGDLLVTLQTGETEHGFIKLDAVTGQTIWEVSAPGLYNGFQYGGSYYAIGHSGDGMSLFLRIDESGDIITTRSLGTGILSDHTVTNDGGLVLTGTTSHWNDQQSDTPLYKTDMDGRSVDTFDIANEPVHVFRIGSEKDANLYPVQMNSNGRN